MTADERKQAALRLLSCADACEIDTGASLISDDFHFQFMERAESWTVDGKEVPARLDRDALPATRHHRDPPHDPRRHELHRRSGAVRRGYGRNLRGEPRDVVPWAALPTIDLPTKVSHAPSMV